MELSSQKYIIISILFIINTILTTTFIIYEDKWYVYLFVLALASIINSLNTILIFLHKIFNKIDDKLLFRTKPVNLIYLVPCYNESYEKLTNTLESLNNQISLNSKDKKLLIIICDGKVVGAGNNKQTSNILTEDILNNNNKTIILDAYK